MTFMQKYDYENVLQEVVERTNTEVAAQTQGEVKEFIREEDLEDIAFQPSLCISNSNYFKVNRQTER